jgi:hypothetical protein
VEGRSGENEVTSVEAYLEIVDEDDVRARWVRVAEPVWLSLLDSGYSKRSILFNKKLPLRVLEILANDGDPEIRAEVASKRAAAPLLDLLARDESPLVRGRVACNAKSSMDAIKTLAHDSVATVANAARDRLGLPPVERTD